MPTGGWSNQADKAERNEAMKEVLKKKAEFVIRLCDLLRTDPRSSIDLLHYEVVTFDGYTSEYVHVCYTGGHHVPLLVTGNSIGAIAKAVINEVYK